jgi:hypothetical protein
MQVVKIFTTDVRQTKQNGGQNITFICSVQQEYTTSIAKSHKQRKIIKIHMKKFHHVAT